MSNLIHMEIAGVSFALSGSTLSVVQESGSAYRSFLRKGNSLRGIRSADVRIRITLGEIPNTENLKKVFDSGQSWSMFQDGNDYCLTRNPPVFKQPLWLTRINHDLTKATVYLSKRPAKQENSSPVFTNPIHYPLDQILLMYYLASRQGALLHAAGIDMNGRGFIFPGKSGAGKSTLTRQFAGCKDIGLLSDDRVVVRKIDGAFRAYGTPWPGEEGVAENRNVPLSGILFIAHGSENRIRNIKPREALERILPVASIPWYDREIMPKMLDFCEDLISSIPTYELYFKPTIDLIGFFGDFVSQ